MADLTFTRAEADLFRQWYDAVSDTNAAYLEGADHALAAKLYEALGFRIPDRMKPLVA